MNRPGFPRHLKSHNNAVGHRDFVGAKKLLPLVFADMEKDF
jgi:hypothetical protein